MRTISIIATCVFAFLVLLMLVIQFLNIKTIRIFNFSSSVLLIISAMLMAYSTYYGTGSDLHRYNEMLAELEGKSFAYAQKNGVYNNTVLTNLLFWIIAQTGNYKLLPFITIGITISVIIYLIKKEMKINNMSVVIGCLFFLLIISVTGIQAFISGIRQHLSTAIFALAIYRDLRLGKKDIVTLLLYLTTCLIHLAAIIYIIIRISAIIKGNIKYMFLFWCVLIPVIGRITSTSGYIEEAIYKLFEYQVLDDVDYRFIAVQLCVLIHTAFKLYYLKMQGLKNNYINFLEVAIIITLGSFTIVHLFSRLVMATIFLSLPLLSEFYEKSSSRVWLISNCLNSFFIVGLIAYQMVFAVNYWQFI